MKRLLSLILLTALLLTSCTTTNEDFYSASNTSNQSAKSPSTTTKTTKATTAEPELPPEPEKTYEELLEYYKTEGKKLNEETDFYYCYYTEIDNKLYVIAKLERESIDFNLMLMLTIINKENMIKKGFDKTFDYVYRDMYFNFYDNNNNLIAIYNNKNASYPTELNWYNQEYHDLYDSATLIISYTPKGTEVREKVDFINDQIQYELYKNDNLSDKETLLDMINFEKDNIEYKNKNPGFSFISYRLFVKENNREDIIYIHQYNLINNVYEPYIDKPSIVGDKYRKIYKSLNLDD